MEHWATWVTKILSEIIEILAAAVIAVALLKFLYRYGSMLFRKNDGHNIRHLRIHFGSSLTLALELLLAADILATAIAPSWDDIGKLAAVAAIRTALNYFLERELKDSENTKPADDTAPINRE